MISAHSSLDALVPCFHLVPQGSPRARVPLNHYRGGVFSSRSRSFLLSVLLAYDKFPPHCALTDDDKVLFMRTQSEIEPIADNEVAFRVPLDVLSVYLPVKNLRVVARKHGIGPRSASLDSVIKKYNSHLCDAVCAPLVAVFERAKPRVDGLQLQCYDTLGVVLTDPPDEPIDHQAFPPSVLTTERCAQLTNEWRNRISPEVLAETTCSVCAWMMSVASMKVIDICDPVFDILINSSSKVARRERFSNADPVLGFDRPLLCRNGTFT